MQPHETCELAGWARAPVHRCHVARPEKRAQVSALLDQGQHPTYIPRGLGRSYGDAALNRDQGVIDHTRLDRFLALDPEVPCVQAEAGLRLADLVEVLLPQGYLLPVTPGTKHVTVGGAIAANVHGKNHHVDGTIAHYVDQLTLATPAKGAVTCSRQEAPDLFWATLGGMGLTGAILTATLRLRPVSTAYATVDRARTEDLTDTMEALDQAAERSTYAVAWLDALAPGPERGRGIVTTGHHTPADHEALPAGDPLALPRSATRTVPGPLASLLLGRPTVRAFNAFHRARHPPVQGKLVDLDRFLYPLDALDGWNEAYGRNGFLQHQSVVPAAAGPEAIQALLDHVAGGPVDAYLAVLKRMGGEDKAPLSFPLDGWSLALDLPRGRGAVAVAQELDRITAEHGGRVYLAKDATLDPATFQRMYPAAEAFRAVKATVDPEGQLASSLSRRIGLTEGACP